MKKFWWVLRAWFWYGRYTSFSGWNWDRAAWLYLGRDTMSPKSAVQTDISTWY